MTKHTEETKKNLSLVMKGKHNSPRTEFKKGLTPWITGKKHLQETKDKMSLNRTGKYKGSENHMYGKRHSEDTIKKMKEAKRGENAGERNPMYGKHHSQKTIEILSKKAKERFAKSPSQNLGKKHSPEAIAKMSRIKIGRYIGSKNPNFGKHHTEEVKREMSRNRTGKLHTEEWKKKIRIIAATDPNYGMKGKHHKEDAIKKMKEARIKRVMPFRDTKPERIIQTLCTELGLLIQPHRYMKEIEHAYQCDIWIPSMNLVIECDGDYWHGNPNKYPLPADWQIKQQEEDKIRTDELKQAGFDVLRLWESDIKRINMRCD